MIAAAELDQRLDRLQRVSQRWRVLVPAGLFAIILGFVVLTIYLDQARRRAETAVVQAAEEHRKLQANANATATTLEAVKAAMSAGDLPTALRLLNVEARLQEKIAQAPPPPVVEVAAAPVSAPVAIPRPQAAAVLRGKAPARLSRPVPSFAQAGLYRVFIQFAGVIQRRQVIAVNNSLRDAGWNVQGSSGERLAAAAGLNEVRYGRAEDKPAADALAAALDATGLSARPVRVRPLSIVRPGVLEAWISR